MTYNPPVKFYYIPGTGIVDNAYRVVPAPQISIAPEIYYANNIAIGYTYNINLRGYATCIDLREPSLSGVGFSETLGAIQYIKNLFSIINGELVISFNDNPIFKATGGMVKNINFSESDNNWVNYSEYDIELEFNEVVISSGCTPSSPIINCGTIPSGIQYSPYVIDMQEYKVKSFEDGWSMSLDDNIYNNYDGTANEHFTISYNISAVGKHYTNTSNNTMISAWEQAKNFCQYKLYNQISDLTQNTLSDTVDSSPESCICLINTENLTSLLSSTNRGILVDIDLNGQYGIFNEAITTQVSESDGSFNLQYTALIKKLGNMPNAIHTYSVTKKVSELESKRNISYSVEGNIQGLMPGGLIRDSGILEMSSSGSLLVAHTGTNNLSKYHHAITSYALIGDGSGLKQDFISDTLNINYNSFFSDVDEKCVQLSGAPKATTFTLTHSYTAGSLTYNATFDGAKMCDQVNKKDTHTASVEIEDSIPMIAEFIIPGKTIPIVQLLNLNTPRKYSLSIEGLPPTGICNTKSINDIVSRACNNTLAPEVTGLPNLKFNNMIMTEEKYSKASDGSYTLNRTYIEYD
jgi:hypothetical protein